MILLSKQLAFKHDLHKCQTACPSSITLLILTCLQ
jgi:hypothetical protein